MSDAFVGMHNDEPCSRPRRSSHGAHSDAVRGFAAIAVPRERQRLAKPSIAGQKAKPRSIDRVVSRMGRSVTFAAPSGQIWMEGGQQQHPYRDGLSILASKFGGVIKIVMSVFSSDVQAPIHPPDATSWFGKDHNTPFYQATQAGPFDQWPNGMGLDYFYGFVGGDSSQWQAHSFMNTTTTVLRRDV